MIIDSTRLKSRFVLFCFIVISIVSLSSTLLCISPSIAQETTSSSSSTTSEQSSTTTTQGITSTTTTAPTPITCGTLVDGSISSLAEEDRYSFAVNANDAITIRLIALKPDGYPFINPYLQLYDPSNTSIANTYYADAPQIDTTLTTAGTYAIGVSDKSNNSTGDYRVVWQRLNNPCNATAMQYGQTATGSIGTVGQQAFYTFTASAGDFATIRLQKTAGDMKPSLELYDASGARLEYKTNRTGNYCVINRAITTAGTYTIIVSSDRNQETGTYQLILPSPTPISCGQPITGSINIAGDQDRYTFSANANDAVTIRATGNNNPDLKLYNSSNQLIASSDEYIGYHFTKIDTVLPATGTYTVVISAWDSVSTGSYTLVWQRLNNPCNATQLQCGQNLSGSISTAAQQVYYSITLNAGDVLTARLIGVANQLHPCLELYGPNGTRLEYKPEVDTYHRYCVINKTIATGGGGPYTIIVSDVDNNRTGDYKLVVQKLNTAQGATCNKTNIPCGQNVFSALDDVGEHDFYSFSGSLGDVVTVRLIRTSENMITNLELYAPDGTSVETKSSYNSYQNNYINIEQTLPAAGTYTLVVSVQDYNQTGDYAITWQNLKSPVNATSVTCGQKKSGSILRTGEQDYYTFNAAIGDAITLRSRKSAAALYPRFEIYDATGTQIADNRVTFPFSAPPNLDTTLQTQGPYTLIVSDNGNEHAGDYSFKMEKLNNPCSGQTLTCGQTVSKLLTTGDYDTYAITAASGDTVALGLTWGQRWPAATHAQDDLVLYSPSGAFITHGNCGNTGCYFSQTLSQGGTYVVMVSEIDTLSDLNYALKFQKNSNACPEVAVTAPNGGEILSDPAYTISWSVSSLAGVSSQEIRLSTDGGSTFSTVIATGLTSSVRSYNWTIPTNLFTTTARVRVIVTDTSNNTISDDSDNNFTILKSASKAVRSYTYDNLNRLTRINYEDNSAVVYTYDDAGNLLSVTPEP